MFENKTVIFLTRHFKHIFCFSEEQSHRDGSFEYPQYMFWLRHNDNFQETH